MLIKRYCNFIVNRLCISLSLARDLLGALKEILQYNPKDHIKLLVGLMLSTLVGQAIMFI